jgi:hypothetical protein
LSLSDLFVNCPYEAMDFFSAWMHWDGVEIYQRKNNVKNKSLSLSRFYLGLRLYYFFLLDDFLALSQY